MVKRAIAWLLIPDGTPHCNCKQHSSPACCLHTPCLAILTAIIRNDTHRYTPLSLGPQPPAVVCFLLNIWWRSFLASPLSHLVIMTKSHFAFWPQPTAALDILAPNISCCCVWTYLLTQYCRWLVSMPKRYPNNFSNFHKFTITIAVRRLQQLFDIRIFACQSIHFIVFVHVWVIWSFSQYWHKLNPLQMSSCFALFV